MQNKAVQMFFSALSRGGSILSVHLHGVASACSSGDRSRRTSRSSCLFAAVKGRRGTQYLWPAAVIKTDPEQHRYQIRFRGFLKLRFYGFSHWAGTLGRLPQLFPVPLQTNTIKEITSTSFCGLSKWPMKLWFMVTSQEAKPSHWPETWQLQLQISSFSLLALHVPSKSYSLPCLTLPFISLITPQHETAYIPERAHHIKHPS